GGSGCGWLCGGCWLLWWCWWGVWLFCLGLFLGGFVVVLVCVLCGLGGLGVVGCFLLVVWVWLGCGVLCWYGLAGMSVR
ncbi:hypothetical protein, partial [Pseudomonas syringae group genomosp. 7]|uniref:hypothetical protein n=1 Tax=Pseudomonas syringae group genomosp. 7 TaxID=251699 RepID=UPI00376F9541